MPGGVGGRREQSRLLPDEMIEIGLVRKNVKKKKKTLDKMYSMGYTYIVDLGMRTPSVRKLEELSSSEGFLMFRHGWQRPCRCFTESIGRIWQNVRIRETNDG